MSNPMMCVPHASRRRSKWYVKLKRRKHLIVWLILCITLIVVIGYGAWKFIRHSGGDQPGLTPKAPIINPRFQRS